MSAGGALSCEEGGGRVGIEELEGEDTPLIFRAFLLSTRCCNLAVTFSLDTSIFDAMDLRGMALFNSMGPDLLVEDRLPFRLERLEDADTSCNYIGVGVVHTHTHRERERERERQRQRDVVRWVFMSSMLGIIGVELTVTSSEPVPTSLGEAELNDWMELRIEIEGLLVVGELR
jgi:hypothetical protein